MAVLAFDLVDALRTVRRDRAYAATISLTLALTLGATTAVFSVVDATLLRPLPFADAGRLVAIREIWREVIDRAPSLEVNERHFEHQIPFWDEYVAHPNYDEFWRERSILPHLRNVAPAVVCDSTKKVSAPSIACAR